MSDPRITDEMVHVAIVAAGDTRWHGDRVAQIRAALEAALPHLAPQPLPTREQIAEAVGRRLVSNPATRLRLADDILALINGSAS